MWVWEWAGVNPSRRLEKQPRVNAPLMVHETHHLCTWKTVLHTHTHAGRAVSHLMDTYHRKTGAGKRDEDWLFAKRFTRGLPWWRSGWESACQCRGHGFEPWSGKIPHAAEQLGPWATATEPARLEPVLRNGRGRDSERPAHRDEEWPPLAATRESPRTATKTQHSQK